MRPPPARCRMGPRQAAVRRGRSWVWSPWKIGTHSASLARAAISSRTSSARVAASSRRISSPRFGAVSRAAIAPAAAPMSSPRKKAPQWRCSSSSEPESNGCRVDQLLAGRDGGAGGGDRNRAPLPDVLSIGRSDVRHVRLDQLAASRLAWAARLAALRRSGRVSRQASDARSPTPAPSRRRFHHLWPRLAISWLSFASTRGR